MRARDASASRGFSPRIPLVVVGALRAGGSGKTSVTLALARSLADRGMRPALLAYRLGRGAGPGMVEVLPEDGWREVSDEALLLKRESGMRVFATRDRAAAWRLLQQDRFQADGAFDILISDDGFQDPRLDGAFRIVLTAPGERPGLFDLLPGGPFRETGSAAGRAHLRIEGPGIGLPPAGVTSALPRPLPSFARTLILPPDFDPRRPWIAFCALGDNRPFLSDLERAGIRPAAIVTGRNHAGPPLEKLRSALALRPEAGILCTRKDFLKLDAAATGLPLYPVDQSISLDPRIPDAVMAWRQTEA